MFDLQFSELKYLMALTFIARVQKKSWSYVIYFNSFLFTEDSAERKKMKRYARLICAYLEKETFCANIWANF